MRCAPAGMDTLFECQADLDSFQVLLLLLQVCPCQGMLFQPAFGKPELDLVVFGGNLYIRELFITAAAT